MNSAAGKPKLRHIKEDLLINDRIHLFLVFLYLTRKYDIMLEKVADQGPHMYSVQCLMTSLYEVMWPFQLASVSTLCRGGGGEGIDSEVILTTRDAD